MFKLSIENFRKIRKASIEVEGLVWITGPNDQGKSCLLKSLPALMENKSGNSFITYGEKETSITLDYPGDKLLTWIKPQKGSGSYTIGDKVLTKTGSTTPPEISDLGFRVITIKDTKYNLHFWPQAKYFLVQDKPSYIFLMVSRLLKHKNFIPMLKQMKLHYRDMSTQETELSGQFKLLEKKKQDIATELEDFRQFKAHDAMFNSLLEDQKRLVTGRDLISRANSLAKTLTSSMQVLDTIKETLQGLEGSSTIAESVRNVKALKILSEKLSFSTEALIKLPTDYFEYPELELTPIRTQITQVSQLYTLRTKLSYRNISVNYKASSPSMKN